MSYKVLIVDDHFIVREGLKLILETSDSFQVVGEAENGKIALQLIEQLSPDIILLDLNMPIMSGLETMKELKIRDNHIPIIILTTYNEDELMIEGIRLGAKSFLLKDSSRDELLRTIEAAIHGETLLHSQLIAKLVQLNTEEVPPAKKSILTEKETFILQSTAKGLRNKEIAALLGIAERTVKAHLTNIYNKLGVNSRTEAVSVGMKQGLISIS